MDEPVDNEQARLGANPSIVLFDLDETLCDYAVARRRRLDIAFRIALRDVPPEQWPDLAELIDRSIAVAPHGDAHFPALLRERGVDDPAAVARAQTWFRRHRLYGLELFADALPAFADIRAHIPGVRFGIVTNGPAGIQRDKVNMLCLPPLVETIVISGEVGVAKPDPAIFALALDRLGRHTSDAIYLGDAPAVDIGGAHAAGIRAVWMNRDGQQYPSDCPPPHAEVASLAAFAHLLARLPDRA